MDDLPLDLPFKFITSKHASHVKEAVEEDTGIPVELANQEKCERADFVICCDRDSLPSYFDGFYTTCADCSVELGYSVHAPIKPVKICGVCAVIRIANIVKKERDNESSGADQGPSN